MISVVIPAYNEDKSIGKCLDSLAKQKTSKEYEVIFVDNNSTDKTKNIASSFKSRMNLVLTSEKRKGAGPARAKGFRIAKGSVFLSTDADTILPKNWIETMSQGLEDNNIIAVTGPCKIDDLSWLKNKIFNIFQPLAMRIYRVIYGHYWLSGFNYGIKKKEYIKAGGIDLTVPMLDDIDLSFRVSKLGKIKFIPSCPVLTSGRRFKNGFLRGMLSYASNFTKYFILKKKEISFEDVR